MNEAPSFLQVFTAVFSLLAVIISIATFVRAGRWRETDEGKSLLSRVDAVEDRMTKAETHLTNLPTKADVASIQAELRGLERAIERTGAGVERIEQFMMARPA